MNQPTKKPRPRQLDLRVRASEELWTAIEKHLEYMQKCEPLRGHVMADAVRELIIRGLGK